MKSERQSVNNMSLNDFQHFIYPFFMGIVAIIGFVAYPILYRQKRNYLNAHRKEITELLYGGDPFPADKKIDWSQQLTMTAAGISALLMIYLEKKHPAKYKKNMENGHVLFGNLYNDRNYEKLVLRHKKYVDNEYISFVLFLVAMLCGSVAMLFGIK